MFHQYHVLGSPNLILSNSSCTEQPEVQTSQPQSLDERVGTDGLKLLRPTAVPRETASEEDEERLMSMVPQEAVVTYGPYYVMGILDYREERLSGLQCALRYIGACPRLERGERINHVSIRYIDQEVFECKLTDLRHGGDGELDELCFEAAKALRDEMNRICAVVKERYQQKPQLKPWDGTKATDSSSVQRNDGANQNDDPCCKLLEPLQQVRMPRIRMNRDKAKAERVKQDRPQEVQEMGE